MDCSIFYQCFHSLGMGTNNERQISYYLRIHLRCWWPCLSWNCCFNYGIMQNGISIKRYCPVKATIGGYKNWTTKLRLVILVPNDRYKWMNRGWKCCHPRKPILRGWRIRTQGLLSASHLNCNCSSLVKLATESGLWHCCQLIPLEVSPTTSARDNHSSRTGVKLRLETSGRR